MCLSSLDSCHCSVSCSAVVIGSTEDWTWGLIFYFRQALDHWTTAPDIFLLPPPFLRFIFLCVVCLFCLFVCCVYSACGSQKRTLESLELKLQMFVSQYWELNPDPLKEHPVLLAANCFSSPAALFLKFDPPTPTHLFLLFSSGTDWSPPLFVSCTGDWTQCSITRPSW